MPLRTAFREQTRSVACCERRKGRRFPTPTGKLEIWTEELEKQFAVYGLSPLPADRLSTTRS